MNYLLLLLFDGYYSNKLYGINKQILGYLTMKCWFFHLITLITLKDIY